MGVCICKTPEVIRAFWQITTDQSIAVDALEVFDDLAIAFWIVMKFSNEIAAVSNWQGFVLEAVFHQHVSLATADSLVKDLLDLEAVSQGPVRNHH